MASKRVEAVRRLFGHWDRGDYSTDVAELFHPDCEVVFGTEAFPDPGTYHGVDEMARAWRRYLEAWEDFRTELQEVIESGNTVVVLQRLHGRGRHSGMEMEADAGNVFEFEDGKIVRLELCSPERALEAVRRDPGD